MKTKAEEQPLLVSIPRAAKRLGFTRDTLVKYIKAGLVKTVEVSGKQFVQQSEIERVAKFGTKPQAPIEVITDAEPSQTMVDPTSVASQSLAEIMALPIHFEERWNLLHASKLPRNKDFLRAIRDLADEADCEREELERDANTGNVAAMAAKAALDALTRLPLEHPERPRAIDAHDAKRRKWLEGKTINLSPRSQLQVLGGPQN